MQWLHTLIWWILRWLFPKPRHRRAVHLGISLYSVDKHGGHLMPVSVELTSVQDLLITIAPTDGAGNPSQVQAGSLVGTSSTPDTIGNGTIVDPNAYGITDAGTEGLLCVTTGTIGSFEVVVDADADLGDGVQTISDVVTGTVSHAAAQNLGLGVHGVPKAKV